MIRFATLLIALAAAGATLISQSRTAPVTITGHVVKPMQLDATDAVSRRLTVPEGFRVTRFASGLGNARMLAAAEDGSVYVTRRETGDVLLLKSTARNDRAEPPVVVARRPGMHGIVLAKDVAYLVTVKEVFVAPRLRDGRLGELRRIIDDLPDAGQHADRTLGIGPDGMLYISVGSTCNACDETNQENATLLRAKTDGTSRIIYSAGLRNTIGFAWHPQTGQLWGMDQGIDWLGDEEQPEELNRLIEGAQYGWPYIFADNKQNPQDEPPGEISMEQWARMSRPPDLLYAAHSSPMQMVFYTGTQFPAEFRGDAFVAMHGSWNRLRPSGYEVVRVRFAAGKPASMEPFMTGFLVAQGADAWGAVGRPSGVAVARDGSLLVADDTNGVIYRVAYERDRDAKKERP